MPGVDCQIHTVIAVGLAKPTGANEGCPGSMVTSLWRRLYVNEIHSKISFLS